MEQNKLDLERNSIDILRNFIEIQTLEPDRFRLVPSCEFVRTSPEFNRKLPKNQPEKTSGACNTIGRKAIRYGLLCVLQP